MSKYKRSLYYLFLTALWKTQNWKSYKTNNSWQFFLAQIKLTFQSFPRSKFPLSIYFAKQKNSWKLKNPWHPYAIFRYIRGNYQYLIARVTHRSVFTDNFVNNILFFSEVWQKKPLFIKRRQPLYNKIWFSTSELDHILKSVGVFSKKVLKSKGYSQQSRFVQGQQ